MRASQPHPPCGREGAEQTVKGGGVRGPGFWSRGLSFHSLLLFSLNNLACKLCTANQSSTGGLRTGLVLLTRGQNSVPDVGPEIRVPHAHPQVSTVILWLGDLVVKDMVAPKEYLDK